MFLLFAVGIFCISLNEKRNNASSDPRRSVSGLAGNIHCSWCWRSATDKIPRVKISKYSCTLNILTSLLYFIGWWFFSSKNKLANLRSGGQWTERTRSFRTARFAVSTIIRRNPRVKIPQSSNCVHRIDTNAYGFSFDISVRCAIQSMCYTQLR